MFLVTTGLKEISQNEKDIVYLGENCIPSINYIKEYKVQQYFWNKKSKSIKASLYCLKVYDTILEILVPFLNNYHKVSKNKRYWDILLGNWLYSFIQVIFDRNINLNRFLKKNKKFETIFLDETCYITPLEYTDYINIINDDIYNLQLYSQILKFKGFEFERCYFKTQQKSVFDRNKTKLTRKIFFKLINFFTTNAKITLTMPYFSSIKSYFSLFFISKGQIKFDDFEDDFKIVINKHRDEKLFSNLYKGESKFIHLLCSLFEQNFPLLFLEGYGDFLQKVKEKKELNSMLYVTSNGLHTNYMYKFFIAENMDKITTASIQHGGYGVGNINPSEDYEKRVVDKFLTWGWVENSKTIPFTHERINKKITANNEGYILYVLTDMPKYVYRIQNSYNSSSIKNIYIPKSLSFISSLKKKKELVIRGYGEEYGFNPYKTILNKFSFLKVDTAKKFHESLIGARLFVVDHMHTTYLETLAMNFPTVIFIDKDYYTFRDPSLIELLYKAKILFYNEIEAASHIDKICDNIDSWWYSEEVQNAREVFCNSYAKTSTNWAKEWHSTFSRLEKIRYIKE